MQVLIVTNYFAPEGGAASLRLTRLARQLHRRGHEVTVLTSLPHYPQGRIHDDYRGRLTVTTDLDGIRVVQTWLLATSSPRISRKLVSQLSFMVSALLRGIALPRPDVVLVEGQPVFTGIAGALLATLKRRPFVLNVSDLWPDHLLSVGALSATHPAYRLARRIVDTMYRRAAAIVAMSPRWAEIIDSQIERPAAATTIYNGVDLDRFRPGLDSSEFRRKHALDNQKICSFIGTFSTQYDFDVMLRVAAALSEDDQVQMVFIGQGSQEAVLRQHLDRSANIRWIPWVSADEVPQAWHASYVTYFALRDHPLYRGTIPAKLYEATASGVPIVAAMEGVGAELVEASGAGVTVACGDAAGLGRALQEILADETARDRYSAAGRRYAEARFDAERVADSYEQILSNAR